MVDWRELPDWYNRDAKYDHDSQPTALGLTPPSSTISTWAGDKYHGGFGPTQLFQVDYWTIRQRSAQLFRENLYARGLIRRLVTNEINTGLQLEAQPDEMLLGLPEDSLSDWTEYTEARHALWGSNPTLCDYRGQRTDGQLQYDARMEALVSGDVLVVLHQDPKTGLPRVQLINGMNVQSPLDPAGMKANATIEHGVERDARKRHIAYWVTQEDGTSMRVPAYGPRTGRRLAWLLYGTDKRLDDVRGESLFGVIMQSLKEIDRYRDSAQRKATLNAILAMWVEKTEAKPGTLAITGGAVRKDTVTPLTSETQRRFGITEHIPGLVIEELQHGERLVPHSTAGTDINFGEFEEAIIQAVAWANEIPPEILRLAFGQNYSASQAAINEFKMYLNRVRTGFGADYCQPIYIEWLISEVLQNRIVSRGFLDAWRDPKSFDLFAAWVSSDWSGHIKPSTDIVKQAKGYQMLVAEGWITNDRASRELTGTKFSKNIKRIKRENELKRDAAVPAEATVLELVEDAERAFG